MECLAVPDGMFICRVQVPGLMTPRRRVPVRCCVDAAGRRAATAAPSARAVGPRQPVLVRAVSPARLRLRPGTPAAGQVKTGRAGHTAGRGGSVGSGGPAGTCDVIGPGRVPAGPADLVRPRPRPRQAPADRAPAAAARPRYISVLVWWTTR